MISIKLCEDKKVWEEFNLASNKASFLQSWAWGDFQEKIGKETFRIGIWEGESIVGVCLLIFDKAKTANFFYVPEGPVFSNLKESYVSDLITYISDLAKGKNVVFLRLDPRKIEEVFAKQLKIRGFITAPSFIQPETTAILDLKKTEIELEKDLSNSTRYNVKMGLRKGVKIRSSKAGEIDEFPKLLQSTAKKKNLVLQDKDYHKTQYEVLNKEGIMEMMVAEYEGRVLAAALVVFYGRTAYYLHAANSYENSNLRVSYPLVWQSVLEAKKKGYEVFDFWGVAKDDSPADPWSGVTAFKMSFGAEREGYQLPFDLPFSDKYKWSRLIERYRKPLRKLISLVR